MRRRKMSKWEPPQRVKSLKKNAVFVITFTAWGRRCEMYSSTWGELFDYLSNHITHRIIFRWPKLFRVSKNCHTHTFVPANMFICIYMHINKQWIATEKILPWIFGCWVNPCCSVLPPQRTSAVMSQTRTEDSGWPELWSPSCLTRCTAEWLSPAKMDGLLGICKQRNMTRWGGVIFMAGHGWMPLQCPTHWAVIPVRPKPCFRTNEHNKTVRKTNNDPSRKAKKTPKT